MRQQSETPGGKPGGHNRTLDTFEDSAAWQAWQAYLDRLDPLGVLRAVLVALTIFGLTVAWSWR
jgi:hypothetical protein